MLVWSLPKLSLKEIIAMNLKDSFPRNLRVLPCFVLILLTSSQVGRSAIIVNQNQMIGGTVLAPLSTENLAQSFQQTTNNITGAALKLSGSGPGDLTISLLDSLGGTELTTGTTTFASVAAFDQGFVEVEFESLIMVTPNTTLYLAFSSNNPGTLDVMGTSDVYAEGSAFAQNPPVAFPDDFAFKTFTDTSVAAVPEPSFFACASVGAFIAIGRRLRRGR